MKQTTKILAVGAASLAIVGGVSVGIATADPTSTPSPGTSASPDTSASPTTPAEKKAAKKADKTGAQGQGGGRLVKRALHGEVTLAGKKHLDIVFQRGVVESISATSVTVKSTDGFSDTYVLASTTKVRVDKAPAEISDIAAKDTVRIVAVKTGDTNTAKVIAEPGK